MNAFDILSNDFINCEFANYIRTTGSKQNLVSQNYYSDNGLDAAHTGVSSEDLIVRIPTDIGGWQGCILC